MTRGGVDRSELESLARAGELEEGSEELRWLEMWQVSFSHTRVFSQALVLIDCAGSLLACVLTPMPCCVAQRCEDEQGRPVKRGYGYSLEFGEELFASRKQRDDIFTHHRPGNAMAASEDGGRVVATWTIGGDSTADGWPQPMPPREPSAPGEAAVALRASEEVVTVSDR